MKRLVFALALLFAPPSFAEPLRAAQVQSEGGVVRFASGLDTPALAGAPELVAQSFVKAHAADFGLRNVELGAPRVLKTRLGAVVRFPALFQGVPVDRAEITVALANDNRIRRVQSSVPLIADGVLNRAISAGDALARAAAQVRGAVFQDGKPVGATREVVIVEGGIARLGYEVALPTVDVLVKLYGVVDAATGEVLRLENRVKTATADEAKVWATNPGKDGNVALVSIDPLTNLAAPEDPDGYLVGPLFDSFDCCTHEGCDATKPAKKVTGTTNAFGFPVAYTTVFCDMQHVASNVKDRRTQAARTNYVYDNGKATQFDPPVKAAGTDPADEDEFAEVHAHHHVGQSYLFFRDIGDPAFVLRDAKVGKKPVVWTNFLAPDYSSASQGAGGISITKFMRVDNAAFAPKETWEQYLPGATAGTFPDTDAMLIFQGNKADFAYDGDVLTHEFTHGVIFSTANFSGLTIDAHGANDEAGAMHEGFADYFAGARSNDAKLAEYVGPRIQRAPGDPAPAEGALRDLENTRACPELLEGEVHNDSQHFSAGIWAMRKKLGTTAALQKTYDGAIYDALVSLTTTAGFADAVNAMADSLKAAFSATAKDDFLKEMTDRGVIGCDKILPFEAGTSKRASYNVGGRQGMWGPFVPGPLQLKVKLPTGAESITVSATGSSGSNPLTPGAATANLLLSFNKPITFSNLTVKSGIKSDAQVTKAFSYDKNTQAMVATFPITAQCGDEVYLTVANTGQNALSMQDLVVNVKALTAGCPVPPDAGEPPDAAEEPAPTPPAGEEPGGCGCSATGAPMAFGALAFALALVRRRRA